MDIAEFNYFLVTVYNLKEDLKNFGMVH